MTAPGTITFTGHPPFHVSFDQSLKKDILCSVDVLPLQPLTGSTHESCSGTAMKLFLGGYEVMSSP